MRVTSRGGTRENCHGLSRTPEQAGTDRRAAAALDGIEEHLSEGRTVCAHCMGGIGRTGTIIGCWLARHGHTGQAALDRLQDLRRESRRSTPIPSAATREQVRYVLDWKEGR